MIKWSEFRDGDRLFEAFLPEHEAEPQEWLLRASCLDQILEERRIRLTWPPRFGPDAGDVAMIEAELDIAIAHAVSQPTNSCVEKYVPGPSEIAPPDPYFHAVIGTLLAEYLDAERSLGLTLDQSSNFLELPVMAGTEGLYPMAITPKRDGRMRRLIALANLLQNDPRVQARKTDLLAALLLDDVPTIKTILIAQGIDVGSDPP